MRPHLMRHLPHPFGDRPSVRHHVWLSHEKRRGPMARHQVGSPGAATGLNVAIVGGSIAGCAAAIALRRSGCEVTVYERSPANLRDRGYGIGIPLVVRDELAEAGYLDPAMPVHRCEDRLWLV